MAALGMGTVCSFRIGCGMISRGEIGLIVTAMGASTGIFNSSEVAVMVVWFCLRLCSPLFLCAAPSPSIAPTLWIQGYRGARINPAPSRRIPALWSSCTPRRCAADGRAARQWSRIS